MARISRNELAAAQEAIAGMPRDREGPVVFPEVQVSRQYHFHVLLLPGESQPTFHRYLAQAFDLALYSGHDTLTVVIGESHYRLSKIE